MIDPRAVIDPSAELAEGVSVGPFSVIGPNVRIGEGTEIGPHAVIARDTTIGRDNHIFQFASVGEDPQDKKYSGETTYLEIGDRNQIREFTTVSRGTSQDAGITRIGSDNLLMAYTHVAHDCIIGNNVILANAASLGGHVRVDDWAILGGFSIVHQFCSVGAHCFAGMGSAVYKDVPPYMMIQGQPAKPRGINSEGLSRREFTKDDISAIKQAYKCLYMRDLKLDEAITAIEELATDSSCLDPLLEFIKNSKRSIIR